MVYDDRGRILFRFSYDQKKSKRRLKKYDLNTWDTTSYIYLDSFSYKVKTSFSYAKEENYMFMINKNGEIMKIATQNRIDSLCIKYENDSCLIKTFYFKERLNDTMPAAYSIGMEEYHINGVVQWKKIYDELNGSVIQYLRYYYDNEKLIFIIDQEYRHLQKLFFYNQFGLIENQIEFQNGYNVQTRTYSYHFQ